MYRAVCRPLAKLVLFSLTVRVFWKCEFIYMQKSLRLVHVLVCKVEQYECGIVFLTAWYTLNFL